MGNREGTKRKGEGKRKRKSEEKGRNGATEDTITEAQGAHSSDAFGIFSDRGQKKGERTTEETMKTEDPF